MTDTMSDTFVIVGAGLAGAKAAETLREEGFDGRVVLLGAEPHRPYERPPLSKDYLRGEADRDAAYVHPEDFAAKRDVELRTSTSVRALDLGGRAVELDGGERVDFARLLLAPGAEPRRLGVHGAQLEGVHYLRTFEDSDALRAAIERGGHAVVVGAGWIGCEVAASARTKGMDVTVVEPLAAPLERVLGRELGDIYAAIHRDHGVQLLTGTGVEAIEGAQRAERVRLTGGRTLECDLVVVGIGVTPRTELAAQADLEVENGVVADERLRTAAEGVFVAGDVANAWHPLFGRRLRVEHWHNAIEQGSAAARGMLGADEPYDRIPYFFSDQYDVGMEYAGHAERWDDIVFRGDVDGREFVAFWLHQGRVVAGMNVNVWDVTDQIQALIRAGTRVDLAQLRDPDVELGMLTGA